MTDSRVVLVAFTVDVDVYNHRISPSIEILCYNVVSHLAHSLYLFLSHPLVWVYYQFTHNFMRHLDAKPTNVVSNGPKIHQKHYIFAKPIKRPQVAPVTPKC